VEKPQQTTTDCAECNIAYDELAKFVQTKYGHELLKKITAPPLPLRGQLILIGFCATRTERKKYRKEAWRRRQQEPVIALLVYQMIKTPGGRQLLTEVLEGAQVSNSELAFA
jgi:hypothetical protein